MQLNAAGWLDTATHLPSPFQNARPEKSVINTCVLHNISLPPNVWGDTYIKALFLGELPAFRAAHPYFAGIADLHVSAHFFIARDGAITQFVATEQRAWHAGVSSFCGVSGCNDFSIGIEMNGADHLPYTLKQYQSVAQLVATLCQHYPALTPERVTTHSAIAPERKTDPGPAFHLGYFFRLLKHYLSA